MGFDKLLKRRRNLQEEASTFIDKWFRLKYPLSSGKITKYKVQSLYASNSKLKSFTEEDRIKFRE